MPLIFESDIARIHEQGEGWRVTTLADLANMGTAALVLRHWSLQARARTPHTHHEDIEEMLYVMRGSGEAIIGDQHFELGAESMLWLETGDSYQFIAGEAGLEILQGYS